ncbi:hypothetical protein M011DRAFT_525974 [Sporormia fimetaria CBS 119925]|uniref:BTB domain-containing protein n=1 Tax=Sporormia fimetaria CBS 119925 TaxID=1340428 RepID=A0A6A6VB25_9PLEO|nr:hypothetical protein M011DRAFT_525974 [Sporormia fimetaria CBS 119925]
MHGPHASDTSCDWCVPTPLPASQDHDQHLQSSKRSSSSPSWMGPVWWRDFAYNGRRARLRMATGSVGNVNARDFARLLSGPMIEVVVGRGETKRKWNIHRNLLDHQNSDLLDEELGDGEQTRLELPDHDPAGFELLVKWLYQGKLDDVGNFAGPDQKYEYATNCQKLYLICERFGLEQLKNVAIDQYRRGLNLSELVPDADEINDVYRRSAPGSQWRKLMTQIAARQIMDPDSRRNVSAYRECFEDNPDFAIELVTAIKEGIGGTLLDDPTEEGNECDYHDHESVPDCHLKGKGIQKQDLKNPTLRPDLISSNSDPHVMTARRPLLHDQPRLILKPPPRRARRQDGTDTGPLRRRLTLPAASTTEMSTDTAVMVPKSLSNKSSPASQKHKWQKPVLPHGRSPHSPSTENQRPVQGVRPPSFAVDSRSTSSSSSSNSDGNNVATGAANSAIASWKSDTDGDASRSFWDWSRLGRIGIISRKSEPPLTLMTSKAATSAVSGVLQSWGELDTSSGSLDESVTFSSMQIAPSIWASEQRGQSGSDRPTGLGISAVSAVEIDPSFFAQTKGSSDDLVAASSTITGTPSPRAFGQEDVTTEHDSDTSVPATPSPPAKRTVKRSAARQTSSKFSENHKAAPQPKNQSKKTPDHNSNADFDRIPTYKIALAGRLLSPRPQKSGH